MVNGDMADLLENFYMPFGGKLNRANGWVQLAEMVPWDQVEEKYTSSFQSPFIGQKAYSARIALGSLIIKERLDLSDRETTLQIQENPYLQFFLGYTTYMDEEPFHHSLLTHFRERKAIKKQLGYVARNLRIIEALMKYTPLTVLSKKHYRQLLIISELYRQQREMMESKTHTIQDRMVSIEQPHVRPMVRGKAGANVEFGAKIAASLVHGYVWIETVQWDNFNEATTLQASVESYKQRFGHYPSVMLADKIYRCVFCAMIRFGQVATLATRRKHRNRDNLNYCKKLGIRLSGPRLGRPLKEQNHATDRKQERQDATQRNAIEGKFGEGKRKLGLGRIRTRGAETSLTVISLQFMVMNLERPLRVLFLLFFRLLEFRYLRWT